MTSNKLVAMVTILAGLQHDASGVGHDWRRIDCEDVPPNVLGEIEAEVTDGKQATCAKYVASNGQHYRW